MRSSRSSKKWFAFAFAIAGTALVIGAELPYFSQDIIAKTALEAALFRIMGLPGGVVTHLRPPWEARSHVTSLIQQSPHDAELYSIRALEEERLQDFTAAEGDWKQYAANAADRVAGLTGLADFYRRRVDPDQELNARLQLGALPGRASERFEPDEQQPQWSAFTQAVSAANDALLPAPRYQAIYNGWIARYPHDAQPYQSYLDWCVQRKDKTDRKSVV